MNSVENQLLTLFTLFDWPCLYQPSVMCVRGSEIAPAFYVPSIRLFVHDGVDVRPLPEMICRGEAGRLLLGCPKPHANDTLSILEMIQQPAIITLDPNGGIAFYQFNEMPGAPDSDSVLLSIERCSLCREWSPQPSFGADVCRGCGHRTANVTPVSLMNTKGVGINLMNGDGEILVIPQKFTNLGPNDCRLIDGDEKVIPLPRMTIWGAFQRLLAGPS